MGGGFALEMRRLRFSIPSAPFFFVLPSHPGAYKKISDRYRCPPKFSSSGCRENMYTKRMEKSAPSESPSAELRGLDAREFLHRCMYEDENVLVLDARPHDEFLRGHLRESVNVCLSNFLLRRILRGSACVVEMSRVFPDRRSLVRVNAFASRVNNSRAVVVYDTGSKTLGFESGTEAYVALDLIRRNLIKGINFYPGNVNSFYIVGGFKAISSAQIELPELASLIVPRIPTLRDEDNYEPRDTFLGNVHRVKEDPLSPAPGPLKVKTSLGSKERSRPKVLLERKRQEIPGKPPADSNGGEAESPDLQRIPCRSSSSLSLQGPASRSRKSTASDDIASPSIILPYLIIGSDEIFQSSDAVALLKRINVTHILNMTLEKENERVARSGLFVLKSFGIEDHVDSEVDSLLHEVVEYIHLVHLQSHKNVVFVHCRAGRSRSATAAIAYLIKHANMPLSKAYECVKAIRPSICPNLGFFVSLQEFEKKTLHPRN